MAKIKRSALNELANRFRDNPDKATEYAQSEYGMSYLRETDGRLVFSTGCLVSGEYVVKIAVSQQGVQANQTEVEAWRDAPDGSPLLRIEGHSSSGRWVVQPKTNPVSD